MSDSFMRFAGWIAYANAGLTIANIVTIMIFFTVGGLWGRLNDGVSVLWALSFIPFSIALYRLNAPANGTASLLAAIIGIAAMLVFAVLQSLLVMKQVTFEQTVAAVLSMTGILGVSLATSGLLARGEEILPTGLVWLTLLLGLGFIVGGIGFWVGGPQHPLAMVGFLTTALVGPVWAIWFGRLLLNGTLTAPTDFVLGG